MTATPTPDPRIDRLYALLPAIHRMRDAEHGYTFQALLRVIAEQVNVVEDDIAQLYENLFIETAQDWVVPYLGQLVGHVPGAQAVARADRPGCEHARVLVPRREVANSISSRRRKGTLALLEQLANDVGGWPARAVEYFKLLGRAQHVNHLHLARHRSADLRDVDALELIGGPFDACTHTTDVRTIDSHRTRGRYGIPSVGVWVFRLRSYSVTNTAACCVEEVGPHCFTFSVLGQDAPLYVAPRPEPDPTHIAEELELPVPIRRRAFERRSDDYYGEGASFAIRTDGWAGVAAKGEQPVPAAQLIAADLSDWRYVPALHQVAVDPVLGRLAFPPSQLPKKGVRVSYHYGFAADLGGGEYARPELDLPGVAKLYRVGEKEAFQRIGPALEQWRRDQPQHAVIELSSSGVYVEPLSIALGDDQTLALRAANRTRPVLRLIDWQTDLPDALTIALGARSRFTLDGLTVTGRSVQVTSSNERASACGAELVIRHCTLVPGWGIEGDCGPRRASEPSLELTNLRARVEIEQSIVGAIRVHADEVRLDPIALCIRDSIVDATAEDRQAVAAADGSWAHVALSIARSTVFGIVDVHAMPSGENAIFCGCVNVARRQIGCMRFCYVRSDCRTPRRYRCQPDGVIAAVRERIPENGAKQASEIANERLRVTPQFSALRYGQPAYAQLATTCATEIARGADDESELGVFHQLYQPQREANLRARLNEYTPADMRVEIIFAS
ncbi:MAG TPA: hypothetical protein VK509_10825 [Polyangiales bacterium]|nr:hypothetical protein [Polyangiales bacterium]